METITSGSPVGCTPLVSVCMITYNHASYIRQAIEGVIMQETTFSFELIIGEDCGTDATRAICEKYQAQYSAKIRLLPTKVNKGVVGNFFATLDAAKGKYIAFCEGDDYWTDSNKLQRQVDFLEANSDYGLVYTEVDFLYEGRQKMQRKVFANGIVRDYSDIETFLVMGGYKAPCTWLFRRELMQHIDLNTITSDATFVLMLEFMGHTKIKFLPEPTAVYRYLTESASHSKDIRKSMQYTLGVMEIQKRYIHKYGLPPNTWDRTGRRMFYILIPWALALRDQTVISVAREFFAERDQTCKEKWRCFKLHIPTIAGWFYRLKYNLK